MKTFIKDLPIYVNGFCTGYLVFGREWGGLELMLMGLCIISFTWAVDTKKTK
jgi:hypothetical protein